MLEIGRPEMVDSGSSVELPMCTCSKRSFSLEITLEIAQAAPFSFLKIWRTIKIQSGKRVE